MNPIYIQNYIQDQQTIFNHLLNDLDWLEISKARKEFFMAFEKLSYTYGGAKSGERTYVGNPFTDPVLDIMNKLNKDFDCNYDVCILNRYDTQHNSLHWHKDNSPEMNNNHPICTVSFGAEREIWWKDSGFKGIVPLENRQLLHDGSVFIMPARFQEDHFHRIPKNDRDCGVRISLTFRN